MLPHPKPELSRGHASDMATDEELLREVYELIKDRPCYWEECIRGDPEGPHSHPFCQQIREWLARYRAHLGLVT